jgi:hypothetical protein
LNLGGLPFLPFAGSDFSPFHFRIKHV